MQFKNNDEQDTLRIITVKTVQDLRRFVMVWVDY